MTQTHDIVGRGNRDGAALFQKWFTELNHTSEIGGQAAYVFVMGSMAELLRVFDLPIVMPLHPPRFPRLQDQGHFQRLA